MALFETSETELTVDQLVGEGKKYKTVDDLAKAYAHASKAIQDREQELAGLRDDLNTRLAVEDQLKKFQEAQTTQSQEQRPDTQAADRSSGDQTDLAKRVKEVIEQDRRETSQRANQQVVQDKLIEVFGTPEKANQIVRQKAQELGVSVQFMESVALQSPKAFFTQLGIQETPQNQRQVTTPSSGSANTQALGINTRAPDVGTYEYFEQIRKDNPNAYWDAKTQQRIHAAAMAGTYVVPDPVYET